MKLSLKKTVCIFSFLALTMSIGINRTEAYACKYKEDYYRLYHVHYSQASDDCIENIYWLEQAVKADFANPMFAYTKIENEEEWEKYRCLFQMHLNLKLIEQHLRLARIYDKKNIYFYDSVYKDEYLSNLKKAESFYEACYGYWEEAMLWAEKANIGKFKFLFLKTLLNWEDEKERVTSGKLDYKKTLDREVSRVKANIEKLSAMEKFKY